MIRLLQLGFLAIFFTLAQSAADKCTPGKISTVSFDDPTLTWTAAENIDDCPIKWYAVYMTDIETKKKTEVLVPATDNSYTFTTLELCKEYKFEVFAISDQNVPGPHKDDTFETTVPNDIDLALGSVNVTQTWGEIDLEWELKTADVSRCITYFDVIYSNMAAPVTESKYKIRNVVPCTVYAIQLNAVIINSDGTIRNGPVMEANITSIGQTPSPVQVEDFTTTTTAVGFAFTQQSYKDNSCEMSTITVSTPGATSGYDSIVVPVFDDPDNDGDTRPKIVITVNGLEPDTLYTSVVTLENEVGTSEPVTIVYKTDKDST